ncbi:probable serine/threonine-protein kinase DDB_G0280133 [Condylostylus longicornis]|uniref:probable serine/threonine-protein kinase DDB_G0280133 n=1 Tax=Condylostylus longicornis TaxID=2530218 RepID=UPI00244DE897|nr:probable serine/threonine-protein kinase DDB_G0280133 [Condylostylus longicornis]
MAKTKRSKKDSTESEETATSSSGSSDSGSASETDSSSSSEDEKARAKKLKEKRRKQKQQRERQKEQSLSFSLSESENEKLKKKRREKTKEKRRNPSEKGIRDEKRSKKRRVTEELEYGEEKKLSSQSSPQQSHRHTSHHHSRDRSRDSQTVTDHRRHEYVEASSKWESPEHPREYSEKRRDPGNGFYQNENKTNRRNPFDDRNREHQAHQPQQIYHHDDRNQPQQQQQFRKHNTFENRDQFRNRQDSYHDRDQYKRFDTQRERRPFPHPQQQQHHQQPPQQQRFQNRNWNDRNIDRNDFRNQNNRPFNNWNNSRGGGRSFQDRRGGGHPGGEKRNDFYDRRGPDVRGERRDMPERRDLPDRRERNDFRRNSNDRRIENFDRNRAGKSGESMERNRRPNYNDNRREPRRDGSEDRKNFTSRKNDFQKSTGNSLSGERRPKERRFSSRSPDKRSQQTISEKTSHRERSWDKGKRQSRSPSPRKRSFKRELNSEDKDYEWGGSRRRRSRSKNSRGSRDSSGGPPSEKQKPTFALSGKLTEDTNTVNGVVIKYAEPPEARKPKRRWRLYPFKGEKAMPTLYIHRQSAYLIGRDRKVCDLPVDHPSCSKQHAVLQYRLVPFERENGTVGKRVRPYILDLESANGTYLNNKRIESKKYFELLEKDVIKFGFSSREYVLLHENSKEDELDDDVYDDIPIKKERN